MSTRDVEAAFTNEQGVCLLSKSAVSELTDALWTEYEAFQQRSLGDPPIFAVFLDGVYESLRAHGITRERRRSKVLPRFFTEKSCVRLVFATLIWAAARWRIVISPLKLAQLHLLCDERGLVPRNGDRPGRLTEK